MPFVFLFVVYGAFNNYVAQRKWTALCLDDPSVPVQIKSGWVAPCPVDVIEGFFMHFCPGTMTTHAESINSDPQRRLDRRLRHIPH